MPTPVRTLIIERIGSVAQLEALLLLHAIAVPGGGVQDGARDAAAVAGALRISAPSAAQILDELAREHLVVAQRHRTPSQPGRDTDGQSTAPLYRFPIENAILRGAVDLLRATYAERRVSVIALIFSKPSAHLRSPMASFSDAFRLRPDPPNHPADPPNQPGKEQPPGG